MAKKRESKLTKYAVLRKSSALAARLRRVALLAAHRLAGYYTQKRFFGLDMGIDSSGKVWIIEANLRPDVTLFLKLPDKTMYHTIVNYRK